MSSVYDVAMIPLMAVSNSIFDFTKIIIYRCYTSAPQSCGGFASKAPEDICMILTNTPSSHWVFNPKQCEDNINNFIESRASFALLIISFFIAATVFIKLPSILWLICQVNNCFYILNFIVLF